MKCKTCNGLGRTKATEFVGVDEGLREVVILCPACGGTGIVVHPMMSMNGDEYTGEWEQHECEMCGGTGEIQQTEQEYIQTCNTEQLAEVLFSWYKLGRLDVINKHTELKKDWLIGWLKQPHNSPK